MAGEATQLITSCCCCLFFLIGTSLFLSALVKTEARGSLYDAAQHHVIVAEEGPRVSFLGNSARVGVAPSSSSAVKLRLRRRDGQYSEHLGSRERIRRMIGRSFERAKALTRQVNVKASEDLNETVFAMESEFLTTLQLGSPPQEVTLIVDTGSDLIWTQCQPCQNCFTQPQPIFDPSKSSTFRPISCHHSKFCYFLEVYGGSSSCNSKSECAYTYGYGDGSYSDGVVATETLWLNLSTGDQLASFPDVVVGCGYHNGPNGFFSNSSGILGLGQGLVSLSSQLSSAIDHRFSFCLVNWDSPSTVAGSLLLGDDAIPTDHKTLTTPIITNTKADGSDASFYYVSLEGISVGGHRLNISSDTFRIQPDGSGGTIVDCGTTITYLAGSAYPLLRHAFTSSITLKESNEGAGLGFDLCYELPKRGNFYIPSLTFHFDNADLALPRENYFIVVDGVLCLAMGSNSGISIFGNIQQQNIQLGFDLKEKKLTMRPTQCQGS